jgi:hypothetical protein
MMVFLDVILMHVKGLSIYTIKRSTYQMKNVIEDIIQVTAYFILMLIAEKKDNPVYITKINGEYNHLLVKNINMVAFHYHKFTPEMCNNVRLLAICSVCAGAIIEVLQVKYPDKYIYSQNIYNMVPAIQS